eukprot:gnl/Dysnectes_brevis/2899_a3542_1179.p1 GENE.gnl/Dysnectes_brevis/2899_a3542_1179~~gnl/Dysnectes_brevis/2899_a3542_1179.p1  ORF type:complete len:399 (-),score=49.61 gnl/Dysnectes_brevis/2899_a3542_1179:35-1231(-)
MEQQTKEEPSTSSKPAESSSAPTSHSLHAHALAASDHYSKIKSIGRSSAARSSSDISVVRIFNNWLKSMLIRWKCDHGFHVLDLCSGKGGDIEKWRHSNPQYVTFTDITLVSIIEAIRRYNSKVKNNPRSIFQADFVWADAFGVKLSTHFKTYRHRGRFDLISCQFAMHYAFGTRERATTLFQNLTEMLAPGACFVATLPSKDTIISRLETECGWKWTQDKIHEIPPPLDNGLYRLTFNQPFTHGPRRPEFGVSYSFSLAEAVESCDEFLVDLSLVRTLAMQNGLSVDAHFPSFADFYRDMMSHKDPMVGRKARQHWERSFRGEDGEALRFEDLPKDQRDVINLYQVIVIKKDRQGSYHPPRRQRKVTKPRRLSDVVNLTGQVIDLDQLKEHFKEYLE